MDPRGSVDLPIQTFLPHRPPFLFVTGIAEPWEGDGGSCYLDLLPGAQPYGTGGIFPALLVVEALAQAAAVLPRHSHGPSAPGTEGMAYLVKLNDFVFEGDARAGDRLLLTARLRRRLGKLVLFKAEASVQGRRICAGEMTFLVEGGE